MWIRQIFQRRREQGEFHNLLEELRVSDSESHFRYLRMSRERFDFFLSKVRLMVHVCCRCCENNLMKVGPLLRRRRYNSNMRAEISPAERMLALTLRYLATGNSQVGEKLTRY